jgi:hypothetical protein
MSKTNWYGAGKMPPSQIQGITMNSLNGSRAVVRDKPALYFRQRSPFFRCCLSSAEPDSRQQITLRHDAGMVGTMCSQITRIHGRNAANAGGHAPPTKL